MSNAVILYDSRKHEYSKNLFYKAHQIEKWIVRIFSSSDDFEEECNLVPEKEIPLHSIVTYLQAHLTDLIPETAETSYFTIEYMRKVSTGRKRRHR